MKQDMEEEAHPSNLWSGGLIAVGLVILQGFISSSSINASALVSVFAFAVAIPILSCNLLMNFVRRGHRKTPTRIGGAIFYWGGVLAAFIGIGAAFWHASWISALIFVFSSLVALIVFIVARPKPVTDS
jgi:hypothetical protein